MEWLFDSHLKKRRHLTYNQKHAYNSPPSSAPEPPLYSTSSSSTSLSFAFLLTLRLSGRSRWPLFWLALLAGLLGKSWGREDTLSREEVSSTVVWPRAARAQKVRAARTVGSVALPEMIGLRRDRSEEGGWACVIWEMIRKKKTHETLANLRSSLNTPKAHFWWGKVASQQAGRS
jgi:hypothetical protein